MTPFSIAGIQMYVSGAHSNVQNMKHKIDVLMAVYPWVQMVVFSELCAFGPLTYYAKEFPNSTEDEFREIAQKHKIWLVPGTMFQKKDDKIYNTATVINPYGEVVGRYNKMFPFYPYEVGVTGGTDFLTWNVPGIGKFGLTICYDMWFPETSRTLAVQGVDVIIHPTLTGTIDRDIELSIVQSTAAINQCYVFDVNGLGDGGNGRSVICGPDGRVIYQANTGEEMIPLEIDIDRVRRSREMGVLRLGQPLKSFRDKNVNFDIYNKDADTTFLDSLGPLNKPDRIERIEDVIKAGKTPVTDDVPDEPPFNPE